MRPEASTLHRHDCPTPHLASPVGSGRFPPFGCPTEMRGGACRAGSSASTELNHLSQAVLSRSTISGWRRARSTFSWGSAASRMRFRALSLSPRTCSKEAFDLLGIERLPGCQRGRSQPSRSKWTGRWFIHRRYQCQPPHGVCDVRIASSWNTRALRGTRNLCFRMSR